MPFLTKGKTNWKYILIVVIFATIVGGGILVYLRYFNKEISSLAKFSEIKKTEKPKIEEEITNWKTYRNEKYGFEIKYPESFTISFLQERTESPYLQIVFETPDPDNPEKKLTLQIGIYDDGWGRDCSETERTGRYVVIENKKYEKCLSFWPETNPPMIQGLWFSINRGNFVFHFELDNTDAFDQILSTFRFSK
jgi:hypothetical protein